ncbi:MAG: SGNH/GDSL hydrolase family protein [Anaerolineae bacterium]|nr:SGNH/GDSL hydrolase family protein [Anaerolineae bacterium]
MKRTTIKRVVFFSIYNVIIILVLLEIAVHFWGYSQHYLSDPIYMSFEESDEIPYILQPNLDNARAPGIIWINTDELGLRSLIPGEPYQPKTPNTYRIAIMGDSFTFGAGVKNQNIYPQLVEVILNNAQQELKVEVFNFGVPGYSVKEMANTLSYRALDVEPDLVIMAFIVDDFSLGRIGNVDKWGYFSGPIGRDTLPKHLLRDIHLIYPIRDLFYTLRARSDNKDEPLPDNTPVLIPDSYRYVLDFKAVAEKHRIPYLVVTIPSLSRVRFRDMGLEERFQVDGVRYFDLSPIRDEFTPAEFRVSQFDSHPSAAVHQRMAADLSQHILETFLSVE